MARASRHVGGWTKQAPGDPNVYSLPDRPADLRPRQARRRRHGARCPCHAPRAGSRPQPLTCERSPLTRPSLPQENPVPAGTLSWKVTGEDETVGPMASGC